MAAPATASSRSGVAARSPSNSTRSTSSTSWPALVPGPRFELGTLSRMSGTAREHPRVRGGGWAWSAAEQGRGRHDRCGEATFQPDPEVAARWAALLLRPVNLQRRPQLQASLELSTGLHELECCGRVCRNDQADASRANGSLRSSVPHDAGSAAPLARPIRRRPPRLRVRPLTPRTCRPRAPRLRTPASTLRRCSCTLREWA
jgi:hypothetical protein